MLEIKPRTEYACLKCGKMNDFKVGTRFPVCSFCENDIFAPISFDESNQLFAEVKAAYPDLTGWEQRCKAEDIQREVYVFNNPSFDKVLYNRMRKAEDDAEYAAEQETREMGAALSGHPKCPTCGSFNTHRISGISKAVSAGVFGIFSQKVKHQFKCDTCGYEW